MSEQTMTNKERKKAIVEELMSDHEVVQAIQRRPHTMVEIRAYYQGVAYGEYGFTKVCYPDKWDADYGIDLAITKACYRIAKRIMTLKEIGM